MNRAPASNPRVMGISLQTNRRGGRQVLRDEHVFGEIAYTLETGPECPHAGLAVALAAEEAAEFGDEPDACIELPACFDRIFLGRR